MVTIYTIKFKKQIAAALLNMKFDHSLYERVEVTYNDIHNVFNFLKERDEKIKRGEWVEEQKNEFGLFDFIGMKDDEIEQKDKEKQDFYQQEQGIKHGLFIKFITKEEENKDEVLNENEVKEEEGEENSVGSEQKEGNLEELGEKEEDKLAKQEEYTLEEGEQKQKEYLLASKNKDDKTQDEEKDWDKEVDNKTEEFENEDSDVSDGSESTQGVGDLKEDT